MTEQSNTRDSFFVTNVLVIPTGENITQKSPITGSLILETNTGILNIGNDNQWVAIGGGSSTQYLLLDGSRSMTGNLDMGNNDIINVNLINGVVIEAHANRHLPNGSDPISTGPPTVTLTTSTTNSTGTSNLLSRSDHTHAIDLSSTSINSLGGILSVNKGGTGSSFLTNGFALQGNGASPVTAAKLLPSGDIVGTTDIQTLTNKTLTSPSISTIINTGTLTLPTSTDTLIGRNTVDELNNKSLIDTTTFIIDNLDNTTRIGFNANGTSGTTTILSSSQTSDINLILPDATDTLVGKNTIDTLTNKTLTSPIISTIVNVGTLTLPTSTDTLVGRNTVDTLTNKTLTSPIISTISNTGILTLPTSTDTLIGRNTTDILTNKSLIDTTTFIVDNLDNTKRINFDAGGSPGTTTTLMAAQSSNRVLVLPDATDTLVGRNTVDTLTNKTLTSPIISTIVNTGTLTLPTSTDTLVGRNTVDTLTNKTLTSPIISTIVNTGTLTLPTSTDTLVGRNTVDTLTNKTLTSPIISTIVNTGTLTLPTSTDTLVGRNTVDTLTNKTLTSPIISTIVNTGTLTLPTSTDTLVGRNTVDTLTNKTISTTNNTITSASSTDSGIVTTGAQTFSGAKTFNGGLISPSLTNTGGILTLGASATKIDFSDVDTENFVGGDGSNVFIGLNSMAALTSGTINVAVGTDTMGSLTSGSESVAIGYRAMQNCGTNAFFDNVSVGAFSLYNVSGNDNTAIGDAALFANTSGINNTGIGSSAIGSNTTGSNNTACGAFALVSATNINNNTAIGSFSMYNTTTGSDNSALGYNSLTNNTTGSNNCAIGRDAMYYNTFGNNNNAFGRESLINNTIADDNNAFGYRSLYSNTTGTGNTAFGHQTLKSNITGTNSCAFGYNALFNCTVGNNNGFGFSALSSVTTGTGNCGFGNSPLSGITTQNDNCAFGLTAMWVATASSCTAMGTSALQNTTGNNNVGIGHQSLTNNSSGANNTAIGYQAGANLTTGSNNIHIGNMGVAAETNTIKIGINGTQTTNFQGGIRGITTGSATGINVLIDVNGQLGTISCARELKENIKEMEDMRDIISNLKVCTFIMKEDPDKKQTCGIIAEDCEEVIPEIVVPIKIDNKELKTVQSDKLIFYVIKEVQRLQFVEKRVVLWFYTLSIMVIVMIIHIFF